MKPWEETWTTPHPGDHVFVANWGPLVAEFKGPEAVARAKLAAQAPAMARLLLGLHFNTKSCPFCGEQQFPSSANWGDCPAGDVLRAAGVIP